MRVSEMFPSKYLRAADIPAGREVPVVVDHVQQDFIEGESDPKAVLMFRGARKGLVLNKTNATSIAEKYGDDTAGWAGKSVIIYATTVLFQGKSTPCIRVRIPLVLSAPAPAAPPATPAFDMANAELAAEAVAGEVPF